MATEKIDLVVYENGERKVIGEAVVDTDGQYLDITGVVTDETYRKRFLGDMSVSLTSGEASIVPISGFAQRSFKARIPKDERHPLQ